jgi:hypothetical protein
LILILPVLALIANDLVLDHLIEHLLYLASLQYFTLLEEQLKLLSELEFVVFHVDEPALQLGGLCRRLTFQQELNSLQS